MGMAMCMKRLVAQCLVLLSAPSTVKILWGARAIRGGPLADFVFSTLLSIFLGIPKN
jgi:hypothetical protein